MKFIKNQILLKTLHNQVKEQQIIEIKESYGEKNPLMIRWKDFIFDFRNNRINNDILEALSANLEEKSFTDFKKALFTGEKINHTEGRAVLHTALRDIFEPTIIKSNTPIKEDVQDTLSKIAEFSTQFRSGKIEGYSGKPLKNIIHIGIGGSGLGVELVYGIFKEDATFPVYFLGNVDPIPVKDTLSKLNPEETLVIVVSKTFTTQETMANYDIIKQWFNTNCVTGKELSKHFVAVTAAPEKAVDFKYIFGFSEWVGGRFSLWSSVGLSLALSLGYDFFERLLKGANEMDKNFWEADVKDNISLMYALVTFWNISFEGIHHNLIIPYSERLARFPAYLQQLETESNGKSVDRDGKFINYPTSVSIWGEAGTNAQHSFFQWIHQGTEKTQIDFVGIVAQDADRKMQNMLLSNLFAQIEALTLGKSFEKSLNELEQTSLSEIEKENLARQKTFHGSKSNNLILMQEITPENVGSLLALYEHKVFVLGYLWNINSFDQFGVELGKSIAKEKLSLIEKIDVLNLDGISQII
jgi:glucose-6-phosphate isomerase